MLNDFDFKDSLFQQSLWSKAGVNALQFKEILGQKLTIEQEKALA